MLRIEKLKEYCLVHWRQVIVGALIGMLLLFCGAAHFFQTNQRPVDPLANTKQVAKRTAGAASSPLHGGKVCVDIKGAVNRPGVYHLTKGSRIEEAIAAAGGSTDQADLNQVNLAKELMDQQVIQIPKFGEQLNQGLQDGGSASQGSNGSDKVNLNTATKEDLMKIDGVGDKKADKILEYRNQHGGFKTPDDLKNISGFGEKTVTKLKDQLAV